MALLLFFSLWSVLPTAALCAPQAAPDPVVELEDVTVRTRRGAARQAPEIELDGVQIEGLGAYDIGEAVERIRETLGLQGAPVILINGRPIVSAANFMGFPPDAMVRVEILPQGAAASYGEAPERPVLNLVLQERYRSRDGLGRASRPAAGGTTSLAVDVRQAEIQGDATHQFGGQFSDITALYIEERPDLLRERPERAGTTLAPASRGAGANLSVTGRFGDWSGAVSAQAQRQVTRFLSRSDDAVAETLQTQDNIIASGGVSGALEAWSIRLGLDGGVNILSQDGPVRERARNYVVGSEIGADRTAFDLPSGPVQVALAARARYAWADGRGEGAREDSRLVDGRANVVVPLLPPGGQGAPWRGGTATLSLGATASWQDGERVGEGGSVGLSWAPFRLLRLNGQWSVAADAPPAEARLGPIYQAPPRQVFDILRGEAVTVTPLLGGNPDLMAQRADRYMLAASLGPFTALGLHLRAGWARSAIRNPFGALPELSPEVEAAFPDRVIRDGNGRLKALDQRALNLEEAISETLTAGVSFNTPSIGQDGPLQVGVNYTEQLSSRTVLRPGLPPTDALAGDGGGLSRRQVSALVNGRVGGWGVNLTGRWREGMRSRRQAGVDGPDDLRRRGLTVVDLKLGRLLEMEAEAGAPASQGLRLEVEINNLFDARPRATLGDGRPAPGYGRDDIDPVGRTLRVSLSRRF